MKGLFPSSEAYARAARRLGCAEASIRAVAHVEAGPAGAFLDTGEPVILFERHLFHGLTKGRFIGASVECLPISATLPGGYGPPGAYQHRRLQAAVVYDREAALKSCSWGLFQILGLNHVSAGHLRLQDFVNAMYGDVDDHLEAFENFIRNSPRLLRALKERDWQTFARWYNGPRHSLNRYAEKMAAAYARETDDTRRA